ncbi:MAG: hypothetical protein D6796_01335, partial [Caldilineae bacterium]
GAITRYASDVLGISVVVRASGGTEGALTLPASAQAGVDAAVEVAGVTYAALLQGGAASVSLGDGAISGDLSADIQDASLGAFVLLQPGASPADASQALNLALSTYPGLAGLPFTLQEVTGPGGSSQPAGLGGGKLALPTPPSGGGATYLFSAYTEQTEVDVRSGQARAVALAAMVGVSPGGAGRVSVFAVVGKGTLAAALSPP